MFEGRGVVQHRGVSGFLGARVMGVAVPGHVDLDEVNLRSYVRRRMESGEIRRGVVFVREPVPRAAIAVMARVAYNEPYQACGMRSSVPAGVVENPGRVAYAWRTRAGWEEISGDCGGSGRGSSRGDGGGVYCGALLGVYAAAGWGDGGVSVAHPAWRCGRLGRQGVRAEWAGLWRCIWGGDYEGDVFGVFGGGVGGGGVSAGAGRGVTRARRCG